MAATKSAEFFSRQRYLAPFGMPFRLLFFQQSRAYAHYHDFHELVIVLEGVAQHVTESKSYPISCGDVFVIKPGVVHCYQNAAGLKLANLMFDLEKLNFNFLDLNEIPGYFALVETEPSCREKNNFKGKHTLTSPQLTEIRKMLNKIEQEMVRQIPGWRFSATTIFQQLLIYIVRSYNTDQKKASRHMVQLGQMVKFIEENFQNNISRDDIIAHGKVSANTGNRIFRNLLGESPIEHLIRVRILHASELLRQGNLTVSEIAFRCGFHDSNYFSLQFKKITGLSPRKFIGK